MKTEKNNIDRLLEQNRAEQLAGVDWGGLNSTISSRLDGAERRKEVPVVRSLVFKVAAGFVAAAAVILIALIVRTDRTPDFQLEDGRLAAVKFIEAKGSALVEVGHAGSQSQVIVDVGPSRSRLATCEVSIIDTNGEHNKEGSNTAWIIIKKSADPVYAENGVKRDAMATLFMF